MGPSISRLREQVVQSASRGGTVIGRMGWVTSKLGTSTRVPQKSMLVVLSLLVTAFFLLLRIKISSLGEGGFRCSTLPSQQPVSQSQDPGKALVESIRRARRLAALATVVGFDSPLQNSSPEALKRWNDGHPCLSRQPDHTGLLSFYNRSNGDLEAETGVQANPLWDEVFEEYANLHRECMQKVGNIGEYFLQKNSSSGCKFLVADVEKRAEFGDKVLVLASSLLYAILTQRVILIPGSTVVPLFMCEPFAGSSWVLDSSSSSALLSSNSFTKLWALDREVFRAAAWHPGPCSSSRTRAPYAAAGIGMGQWQPQQRFYCTREQHIYSGTTFVYLSGFVYTIPKLFAAPAFRPALDALFPDRIVLTRLLRSAFLPGNPTWNRVKRIHQGYLQPAHRQIGIELRYNGLGGLPRYKPMNKIINQRITDCLIQNDILPNVTNSWEKRVPHPHQLGTPDPAPHISRVLISSFNWGLKDHLARIYERNPTSTGEAVGVVQVSQLSGTDERDSEAFKQALLLSFSDQLLVTPMSTLGSVAQAYGGLIPWFVDVRTGGWLSGRSGTGERGKTIEVCSHFAEKKYSCSESDSALDGQLISDVVPYIENCLPIDHAGGIQLITRSGSQLRS